MQVVWSAQAQDELFELLVYYREIDSELATMLAERVAAAADPFANHPALGPVVPGTAWRKWRVRRAPFILLYQVQAEAVEIVHVRHAASNWRDDA
jgi:plasmid stabilization system protein ParE